MKKTICILAALLLTLCVFSGCSGSGGGSDSSKNGDVVSSWVCNKTYAAPINATAKQTIVFYKGQTFTMKVSADSLEASGKGTYEGDASKTGMLTLTVNSVDASGTLATYITKAAIKPGATATVGIDGDMLFCNNNISGGTDAYAKQ